MKILSIETSCDETAVAIVEDGQKVLAHSVASSLDLHAKTGGVVPEVASRQQLLLMIPTLLESLWEAVPEAGGGGREAGGFGEQLFEENTDVGDLARSASGLRSPASSITIAHSDIDAIIDAIAVTQGPGLIGSLLVGVETAKALSFAWGKPLIPVNHMLGHVYGAWLTHGEEMNKRWPKLVLLVSGGHTELLVMESHSVFYKVGETLDDAAGEAFDKVAKLMGLPYPGGPVLSKLARDGDDTSVKLPQPMAGKDNIDFSFSGLKTAVLHYTRENPNYDKADLAASFERVVVESLVRKTKRAAELYGVSEVVLGGGVAANGRLREALVERLYPIAVMIPDMPYTTDNGAVIGAAAFYQNKAVDWREVQADPGLSLPSRRR